MIDKIDLVQSLLSQYFYYKNKYEELVQQIDDIWYQNTGVHSPNMSGIHVAPEDKGKKILRIGEDKIRPLEREKDTLDLKIKSLHQTLHLFELQDYEYDMLEMIYRFKKKYEDIAKEVGYVDKAYVSRKRAKIEEGIKRYL